MQKIFLYFILVFVAALAVSTQAWSAQESSDCGGSTQLELTICAAEAATEADKKLNIAYQAVLAGSDKERKILVRKAQRAWLLFRDANCEMHYDMTRVKGFSERGSMANELLSKCLTRMTEERTKELSQIEPME